MLVDQHEDEHPADAISVALVRANSILSAISNCFVDKKSHFAVNEPFVAQAVRTVEGLLSEAGKQLDRLYEEIDLNWKNAPHIPVSSGGAGSSTESYGGEIEIPARTYDDLLRKLTAAEVFAADLVEGESNLLPLLNDIKEELERNRKFG